MCVRVCTFTLFVALNLYFNQAAKDLILALCLSEDISLLWSFLCTTTAAEPEAYTSKISVLWPCVFVERK